MLAAGLALTCASHAVAQGTTSLRGPVRDSATRQPVSGAIVEFAGPARRHVVRSDEVGEFQVDGVALADYRMVVRRIGYAPLTREVSVMSGMKPLELVLSPVPQSLREVRVRGEGSGIFGQIGRAEDLAPLSGYVVPVPRSSLPSALDADTISQTVMKSAAIMGPMTNPLRPTAAMPPRVEIRTR